MSIAIATDPVPLRQDERGVIRVGSTLQQQSGHFRVVSNTGSAVQHALPLRSGLVVIFEESAVGAGSGIEQRCGRRIVRAAGRYWCW